MVDAWRGGASGFGTRRSGQRRRLVCSPRRFESARGARARAPSPLRRAATIEEEAVKVPKMASRCERKDAPVRGGTRARRAPATYLDRDRQRERGLGLGLGLGFAILGRLALGRGGRLVAHRAMRSEPRSSDASEAGQRQLKREKNENPRVPRATKSVPLKKSLSANQRPASSNRPTREPVRGRTRATRPVFKHPTTARRTPHRRQNGRCHQRLHRRARRRPQGASRFGVDRSRERRARVSGEDHGRTSHPARACQHPNLACRTYLTPSAAPLLHPQRVAARRTFFGKGVAGLAPVRYV